MNTLSPNTINYISEQDDDIEAEFKQKVSSFLNTQNKLVRAYLSRVGYKQNSSDFNVALCLKVNNDEDLNIIGNINNIFKSMFGKNEHLDIIFLDEKNEQWLRKACCPFYTSKNYLCGKTWTLKVPDQAFRGGWYESE